MAMLLRSTITKLPKLSKFPCSSNNVVSPIIVRTCTHQPNSKLSAWSPIYKCPSIKLFAGFNKLKIYQSAVTTLGVSILMGLEMSHFEIFPHHSAELFGVIGLTATITLCIFSLLSTNVIGFVYVNRELKQIRFSYIDFWGRRKNQDLTLDELLSTDEKWMFNSCTLIKTKTAAGSFKLLTFGEIIDPKVFHMIFGDI